MSYPEQSTAVPVMRTILRWSLVLTAAIIVLGGIAGWFVAGWSGVWSAVAAGLLTLVFTGVTGLSIMLANRFEPAFFMVIVLGAWVLKLLVFLGALALIKQLGFAHPWMLWSCMVVAIIGQLAIDVIVVMRARQGYVSDIALPGENESLRTRR